MHFLKCILCDTPNVTYAMQECMGKIEFMAKMSTPTYFLTIQTLRTCNTCSCMFQCLGNV